jgi:uncharacterized protein YbaP (TraB family)
MKVKCSAYNVALQWRRLLFIGLLTVTSALAGENFDHGLLWKIEGHGGEPSYLFGTMHSEDPRVVRLPVPVQQAFDRSHGVTLEVILDPESLLAMTSGFMFGDGSTLEAHIGAPLYRRTVTAVAAYGIPEILLASMKPWAVAVTLMTPPTRTGLVLDLVLYQRAVADGKPVDGLETPLEQLSVFDGLSEQDQVALLKDTLDNLSDIERMLDDVRDAYLARDLRRLVDASDASMRDSDPQLVARFSGRLITERNHRMVERMQSRLRKGGQFIAVGALHLPGDEGVLQLLNQQGYRLTRVY